MKYAKKIVLYPSARSDPLSEKMVELDRQMSEILARKDLTVEEKISLYNDILTKNLTLENQYKNQFADDQTPSETFEIPKQIVKKEPKRIFTIPPKVKTSRKSLDKTVQFKGTYAKKQKNPLRKSLFGQLPKVSPVRSNKQKTLDETIEFEETYDEEQNEAMMRSPSEEAMDLEEEQPKPKKKSKATKKKTIKGYNKSNKIKKQLENQLAQAWSTLEDFDRVQTRAAKQKIANGL